MRRRGRHGPGQDESPGKRYQMKEKLISIGDDFYIEDEHGQRVFKVDGKAVRIRETLKFEDLQGNELCAIKEKMIHIKDTMNIYRDGDVVAKVKKALISPIRDRYTVKVEDGPDMDIKGNIVDHEYKFEQGREKVAEVSKKWFRVRDTYGVEIAPGQKDILILAATVAIDMMSHP